VPRELSADFVCAMEDVLDVYRRPYDPKRPVIAMDEVPKQLVAELRRPIPARPGRSRRVDYEYKRNGTANIFILFEPLVGRRQVKVTRRRTKVDWAHLIRELVDVHHPEAQSIVLVMDNLNTHSKASLYEAFEPKEAKRIADKLEIHYTPKHGSWLNVAECELSILSRQCLDRRIPDIETLRSEVETWQQQRDGEARPVDWHFTVEDARIRLRSLYPSLQC
jgi:transposase